MISKNVMKLSEWKGCSVWYKAACSCDDNDCDCYIEFEIDKDFGFISVNFSKTLSYSSYYSTNYWFQRLWLNTKTALKILFTGYISMESSFIIQDKEQLDAFIEALNEGRDKILEWKYDFDKNNKVENVEDKNEN